MPPRTLLVAKLKGMTAVTDIVGQQIYPIKAPQGVSLPYITFQQISDVPINASKGATPTAAMRMQVNCFEDTYDKVHTLAAAVRGDEAVSSPTGLSGWIDGNGEVWHLDNELESADDIRDGQDEFQAYAVIQDYLVWHARDEG